MKIAVLGCGPAGLLAAHAATLKGHEVDIYSRKQQSKIHGAQYIHESIPELCDGPPTRVSYVKLGDSTGYAEKVYGSPLAPTSWESFPNGDVPAWPMVGAYNLLWSKYAHLVKNIEFITGNWLRKFMEADDYDLVFNSIPRNALCEHTVPGPNGPPHEFNMAKVVFLPACALDRSLDNVVMYSGRPSEPWYRTSRLFGHAWTEYPSIQFTGHELPDDWRVGIKPTDTDCTCHVKYPKLVRIGRFGQWSKKVLVTDAYELAEKAIDGTWSRGPEPVR